MGYRYVEFDESTGELTFTSKGTLGEAYTAPFSFASGVILATSITKITFQKEVIAPVNSKQLFYNLTNLTTIDGLSNVNTSNVENMSYMFADCNNLTSLDLTNFDTSKVTDMTWMFHRCSSLPSLDLTHFSTSNVTDMSMMFGGGVMA